MRSNEAPFISVILSIFNGEDFLKKSINSVLEQTYDNFELIIIDDCSNDNSYDLILEFVEKDSRVKVIKNKFNMGLTKSLIKAIEIAKGEYIFRQDVDEISYNTRFEEQIKLLKNNDVVAVGCNSIDIYYNKLSLNWGYNNEKKIKKIISLKTIFPHGSAAFNKKAYFESGGYDASLITCQDFDLWNKLKNYGRILMTKETLLKRYIHTESISHKKKYKQFIDYLKIRIKYNNLNIILILFLIYQLILLSIPNFIIVKLKNILE